MREILFASPFVPPEWIAAHDFLPRLYAGQSPDVSSGTIVSRRGVCPYAGGLVDTIMHDPNIRAAVLTTVCDQMRYAASVIREMADRPVFLLNVPSTFLAAGSHSSCELYIDELRRLGRFLERLSGREPDQDMMLRQMVDFDTVRALLRRMKPPQSVDEYRNWLLARSTGVLAGRGDDEPDSDDFERDNSPNEVKEVCEINTLVSTSGDASSGINLALLGGPLRLCDAILLDHLTELGAHISLDASTFGERTLPDSFDEKRLISDPVSELGRAYFDAIPDVFRRPNEGLFEWLASMTRTRQIDGIIFLRCVSCDLWHAELPRIRERLGLPVLDLDVTHDDESVAGRGFGRVEAFIECLR